MKNTENEIIGELIQEITENGFHDICIDLIPDEIKEPSSTLAFVSVRRSGNDPASEISVTADNMIEALECVVNSIRVQLGKPTLEEEVANMISVEEEHAKELIQCGPGARCACGSGLLSVDKSPTYKMVVELATGEVCFAEPPAAFTVENGDIARCPSCKNWFQLRA